MINKKINIGTLVECINDEFHDMETLPFRKKELYLPRKGMKYTVRESIQKNNQVGLRFEEVKNEKYFFGIDKGFLEPAFGAYRFALAKK